MRNVASFDLWNWSVRDRSIALELGTPKIVRYLNTHDRMGKMQSWRIVAREDQALLTKGSGMSIRSKIREVGSDGNFIFGEEVGRDRQRTRRAGQYLRGQRHGNKREPAADASHREAPPTPTPCQTKAYFSVRSSSLSTVSLSQRTIVLICDIIRFTLWVIWKTQICLRYRCRPFNTLKDCREAILLFTP